MTTIHDVRGQASGRGAATPSPVRSAALVPGVARRDGTAYGLLAPEARLTRLGIP
jgi:hypothetical protein